MTGGVFYRWSLGGGLLLSLASGRPFRALESMLPLAEAASTTLSPLHDLEVFYFHFDQLFQNLRQLEESPEPVATSAENASLMESLRRQLEGTSRLRSAFRVQLATRESLDGRRNLLGEALLAATSTASASGEENFWDWCRYLLEDLLWQKPAMLTRSRLASRLHDRARVLKPELKRLAQDYLHQVLQAPGAARGHFQNVVRRFFWPALQPLLAEHPRSLAEVNELRWVLRSLREWRVRAPGLGPSLAALMEDRRRFRDRGPWLELGAAMRSLRQEAGQTLYALGAVDATTLMALERLPQRYWKEQTIQLDQIIFSGSLQQPDSRFLRERALGLFAYRPRRRQNLEAVKARQRAAENLVAAAQVLHLQSLPADLSTALQLALAYPPTWNATARHLGDWLDEQWPSLSLAKMESSPEAPALQGMGRASLPDYLQVHLLSRLAQSQALELGRAHAWLRLLEPFWRRPAPLDDPVQLAQSELGVEVLKRWGYFDEHVEQFLLRLLVQVGGPEADPERVRALRPEALKVLQAAAEQNLHFQPETLQAASLLVGESEEELSVAALLFLDAAAPQLGKSDIDLLRETVLNSNEKLFLLHRHAEALAANLGLGKPPLFLLLQEFFFSPQLVAERVAPALARDPPFFLMVLRNVTQELRQNRAQGQSIGKRSMEFGKALRQPLLALLRNVDLQSSEAVELRLEAVKTLSLLPILRNDPEVKKAIEPYTSGEIMTEACRNDEGCSRDGLREVLQAEAARTLVPRLKRQRGDWAQSCERVLEVAHRLKESFRLRLFQKKTPDDSES